MHIAVLKHIVRDCSRAACSLIAVSTSEGSTSEGILE